MTGLEIVAIAGLILLFMRPKAGNRSPVMLNRAGIAAQSSNQNQQAAINSAVQQNIQRILGGLRGQAAGARSSGATSPGGSQIGSGGTGTSNRPTQVNPGDPNLQVGDITTPAQDLSSGLFTTSGAFVQSDSSGGLITTLPSGDIVSSAGVSDPSGNLIQVPVDTSTGSTAALVPIPTDSNAMLGLDLSAFDGSGVTNFDSGINSGGFSSTDLGGVGL